MYKLTAYLEQHTYYINFSNETYTTGLRATDVKPRLDNYIKNLQKYLHLDQEDKNTIDVFNKTVFCKETKKGASPYKLFIYAKKNKDHSKSEAKNTLFFGNMGETTVKKSFDIFDDIRVEVKSYDKNLLDIIKIALPIMFAYENFGTRQNKGFGSFTVKKINDKIIDFQESYKKTNNIYDIYSFRLLKEHLSERDHIYKYIKEFYTSIKSGINLKIKRDNAVVFQTYSKSLLWEYFFGNNGKYGNNTIWEKRYIKEFMFNGGEIPEEMGIFIRVLLGLSDKYEFRANPEIKIENTRLDETTTFIIKPLNEKIERFPSPILFKPIKYKDGSYKIFIILNSDSYYNENSKINITNEEYKVFLEDCIDDNYIGVLPTYKDFNLDNFFKFVMEKFNNQNKKMINKLVKTIRIKKEFEKKIVEEVEYES